MEGVVARSSVVPHSESSRLRQAARTGFAPLVVLLFSLGYLVGLYLPFRLFSDASGQPLCDMTPCGAGYAGKPWWGFFRENEFTEHSPVRPLTELGGLVSGLAPVSLVILAAVLVVSGVRWRRTRDSYGHALLAAAVVALVAVTIADQTALGQHLRLIVLD